MDNPAEVPIVNALDIGVAVLVLISAAFAYARGLVHEVLSVAGWIGAIFATFHGFPFLRPYARQLTTIDIVADFGAGIVIFVLSLVILSLLTRRISKKVKDSTLNAVDRSLGFLFGLLRGALVVCIAYIGLEMFYPQDDRPQWISEARSMELIEPGAALLAALIPENFPAAGFGAGEDAGDSEEKKDADDKESGTRRVVQELLAPKPKGADDKKDGAPEGDAAGYGEKARQQMDRLNEILKDR
ncbi:MAG: CvpA family protein [Proteobacteria bacterium]|nr:CvpA family protein [Pseudomonadota bacterium]